MSTPATIPQACPPRSAPRRIAPPRSFTALLALFAGSIFLTASLAAAQQPEPRPAPIATLHATSRIVYVEVIVHDGFGHLVHGLKQGSFTVTENGHPQAISLFREHTSVAAAAEAPASAATTASAPAHPLPISNVPAQQPDTALDMVLLDLLNTSPTDQAFARIRMISFLRSVPAGHRVALFILSDQLHMVEGVTTDSASLAQAAESINIRQLGHLRTSNQKLLDNDSVAMISSSTDFGSWGSQTAGLSFLGPAIQDELNKQDRSDMKERLDKTYTAFQQLARAVSGISGRKNLFWLAGEFPSSDYFTLESLSATDTAPPGPGVGASSDNFTGLNPGTDLAIHPFSERVNKVIADSQIAVYPIDLSGISPDNIGPESSGVGTAGASTAISASVFFDERFNNRVTMNRIADETGGEAFYGNNDAAVMLKHGFDDGENFYTLAYQPTDRNWNGGYRKIKVQLAPGGYGLAYRRGYFALPDVPTGEPKKEFASAMQLETPTSTMLRVSALPPVKLAPGVMRFNATLGLAGVSFSLHAEDKRHARLQVMLIAYPLAAGVKPSEINNVIALGLMPADYDKLMSSGVPLQQTLHLKPGRYVLRLGVLDTNSGKIGTLTLPFTMPTG